MSLEFDCFQVGERVTFFLMVLEIALPEEEWTWTPVLLHEISGKPKAKPNLGKGKQKQKIDSLIPDLIFWRLHVALGCASSNKSVHGYDDH